MTSLEDAALDVVKTLQNAGHTAYFVGGYVRDRLMKHPTDDIDIASTASVEEVVALFPKTIPVGVQFGIVVVVWKEHAFEVATFRSEEGYKDGRRPTSIAKATPEEDARRRDFTINGIFYDPIAKTFHDYVEGQKDIKARVVRAIGKPKDRFLEDRLRMIRAVRYAARFNFAIETKTKRAIGDHAHMLFPSVAIERVWQELQKMARFSNFDIAIIGLHEMKLLPVIFPELRDCTVDDIAERTAIFHHFPKDAPLVAYLLELFPDYNLSQKILFCERFKLSNKEKNFLLYYDNISAALAAEKPLDPYQWTQIYAHPDFKVAFDLCLSHYSVSDREKIVAFHLDQESVLHDYIQRAKNRDPIIKAQHLLDMGIKPGPEMGQLLLKAERIAVNQQLTDPEKILEILLHRE